MLPIEALQERVGNSELGQQWINAPLMNKDVWSVKELGYTEEEMKIRGQYNIYFEAFSLPWLKLLGKLTALATAREKCCLDLLSRRINYLRQFDQFLISKGYFEPEIITEALLQEFISSGNQNHRRSVISYVATLWTEEQWIKLPYIPRKYKRLTPKVETIPEEVLFQIYENFDLFPQPLERLFRLQLALGFRIGELIKMPRKCLKKEGDKWFLMRWIQKRKIWRFYQIHPLVAELVQEQQKFLDVQFGCNSDFDKLFCKISRSNKDGAASGRKFEVKPIYFPEVASRKMLSSWLKYFREEVDLKDKQGNKFKLTSHMFRRTKASIMAYCEAEDEYIAAVLGHGSLDMLPHYRKRSLERLEKEANARGYVDMYGRVTSFKPRKRRYEELADLMKSKFTIGSGECHRPTMLGDCNYRYACIGCGYHRVTEEDKPIIGADIKNLKKDLNQAKTAGQERRVTEINRLLDLLITRLQGLEKLENLKGGKD